jgi:hypothetical protein
MSKYNNPINMVLHPGVTRKEEFQSKISEGGERVLSCIQLAGWNRRSAVRSKEDPGDGHLRAVRLALADRLPCADGEVERVRV